jgi:hypothetical protein
MYVFYLLRLTAAFPVDLVGVKTTSVSVQCNGKSFPRL